MGALSLLSCLRYVYLPLGGRVRRVRNVVLTFVFVALWHGVEPHVFGWALLMGALLAPEILATRALAAAPELRTRWYFRHTVAAAGASTIVGLLAANAVGFGQGPSLVGATLVRVLASAAGLRAAAVAWAFLFVGVQIMLDVERAPIDMVVDGAIVVAGVAT